MGTEPLQSPGAASSGPPGPGPPRGRRREEPSEPPPLRGGHGRCAGCEFCGDVAAGRDKQGCKGRYEVTLPQLLRQNRERLVCARCGCDDFPLPTAHCQAPAGLTPAQGLPPARASQGNSPGPCLRMFSFGLADPRTSAGLNAIKNIASAAAEVVRRQVLARPSVLCGLWTWCCSCHRSVYIFFSSQCKH